MRIVLDTNILISACWKPGGLEEQVVELGLARRFIIAVSPALWAEYIEVLRRPKFKSIQPRVDLLIARLKPVVWKVVPVGRVSDTLTSPVWTEGPLLVTVRL